jgi:hypothetical protein
MITTKNLLIVLILIVLAYFIFSNPKYLGNETIVSVKVDTLYKHDTIRKYKKGDMIPFAVLDTLYLIDSIKVHDTIKIVQDYNQVKVYSDTLRINTDNFVSIQDTISQNKIFGRGYNAHFTEKTIVVTNDIYHKPKNELFVGLVGDLRRFDNKIGAGVSLNYKKKSEAYTFNFTTNQISLGFYKKLF